MTAPAVRFPFRPDRVDALVDFAAAHGLGPAHGPPVRRLLTSLAPVEGVIVVGWKRRTALVVAVVDRCENLHDAALFEVLGWMPQAPSGPLLDVAVPIAEAVGRAAGRRCLKMALPAGLAGWDPAQSGWAHLGESYTLHRPPGPWEASLLPSGARWEDLTPAGLPEHYALVRAAAAEDPEILVPAPDAFEASCFGGDLPVRVLRKDGGEIAFARMGMSGEGSPAVPGGAVPGGADPGAKVGEVLAIGRAAAWRGRGLGAAALAEALRILHQKGATSLRLGVWGGNAPALDLYRRAGFVEQKVWHTWARPLQAGA